jgi:hypothetical protein
VSEEEMTSNYINCFISKKKPLHIMTSGRKLLYLFVWLHIKHAFPDVSVLLMETTITVLFSNTDDSLPFTATVTVPSRISLAEPTPPSIINISSQNPILKVKGKVHPITCHKGTEGE